MGVKTKLDEMKRQVGKIEKGIEKLLPKEKRAREIWKRGYEAFLQASSALAKLEIHGTKREARIKKLILDWPARSVELTKTRDDLRRQIENEEKRLQVQRIQLAQLLERVVGMSQATDEIVKQVFAYNSAVVRAAEVREDYLTAHVFSRLIDEKGKLRSQITFDSSDGLRRVVAMVNTMTIVRADLAAEAMANIQKFFDRVQQTAAMDATTQALYELTKKLLVEKTSFKVGPDLYRFLAIEFDSATLPELALAQQLLRESIRSEKTTSYIRIFERDSHTDKWRPVKQI
jgi:hypothetical protein